MQQAERICQGGLGYEARAIRLRDRYRPLAPSLVPACREHQKRLVFPFFGNDS